MKSKSAVDYWFTIREWGADRRTGAIVECEERLRRSGDRPGKGSTVWDWKVTRKGIWITSGTAQNQQGARRAARRIIRELPDAPESSSR